MIDDLEKLLSAPPQVTRNAAVVTFGGVSAQRGPHPQMNRGGAQSQELGSFLEAWWWGLPDQIRGSQAFTPRVWIGPPTATGI